MAISDVTTFAHLGDADVEALGREFDAMFRPDHHRDARSVNVRVHQAGWVTQLGESHGQVHGYGGLSHAAFPGAHRDQILHAWNG